MTDTVPRPSTIGREVNPAAVQFVRSIRRLRMEHGLSPEDLADETGLSPEAIRKIERLENGHLRLGTALRLYRYFRGLDGITFEALIHEEGGR